MKLGSYTDLRSIIQITQKTIATFAILEYRDLAGIYFGKKISPKRFINVEGYRLRHWWKKPSLSLRVKKSLNKETNQSFQWFLKMTHYQKFVSEHEINKQLVTPSKM